MEITQENIERGERMQQAGVSPEDIRSVEDLVKLPFTEKMDLRDNYPFGMLAVPKSDIVRVHGSSGTTGKPILAGYTAEDIDCWFDSGSMPFAQWHYPFENKEIFESQFPANFISEGVDQTRGWFYSLMAISTLIFDCAPYKNVLVLGHVLDKDGQKMSKSKGNAVDPFEALEQYGADAIRWYFYSNSAPWLPNRFFGDAVVEGQRKLMGTLWNTYAVYVLYANIDGFDPTKYTLDKSTLSVMDKWVLSKLNSTVKTVDNCLAN